MIEGLFYGYFDAWDGAAREGFYLAGFVGDDSVAHGVDSEITAELCAGTGALGHANLTHNNLSYGDFLATKKLNTKPLAGTIVVIFGRTARFNF